MNQIIIIGNLTADPELTTTQSGISYCRFSVAVNRPYKNSNGDREVDFFNVVAWRDLGERCAKYLFKGNKVGIKGSMQFKNYEDRDGIKRKQDNLVADEVEFLTPKSENDANNAGKAQTQQQKSSASRQTTVRPRTDSRTGQMVLDPVPQEEADDLPF